MKRLAVIIINYRTPDLVIDALESIATEIDRISDIAVVVDNDSGDGSAEILSRVIDGRGWSDWIQLVRSPVNGGFSAGNNLGFAAVQADFYLLLNSDAYVRPGAIARLMEEAQAQPEAGFVSPRLEWPDGSPQISCFRWHRPPFELIHAAGTGIVTRLLRRYDVPLPLLGRASWPEWTSFACVLVRRGVLEELGPMDDRYFMYFDDVDYCRRARRSGWRVRNCPDARVVHLRGGTSPVKASVLERRRIPAYYYASRARYYAKFYGTTGLWASNLLWMVGRAIAAARELVGQKQAHAAKAAWRDIWIGAVSAGRDDRRSRRSTS